MCACMHVFVRPQACTNATDVRRPTLIIFTFKNMKGLSLQSMCFVNAVVIFQEPWNDVLKFGNIIFKKHKAQ